MSMQFYFFGTSSGTPTLARNVSGLALKRRQSKNWVLVDCGEGTQHQVLRSPLSLAHLQAICITHVHGDHCYGLPGLLASAGLSGRKTPLTLIAPRAIERWVHAVCEHTDLHLGYEWVFHAVDEAPLGQTLWQDGPLSVCAHALSHRVPSFAYAFTAQAGPAGLNLEVLQSRGVPRGPMWGDLQRGVPVQLPSSEWVHPHEVALPEMPARRVVVAGDNDTPSLMAVAGAADVWVHEATYTEAVLARVGPGPRHSSAASVARAASAAAVPHLVLTHFSPRYHDAPGASPHLSEIETEARAHYAGQLHLAHDMQYFTLSQEGVLSCTEV